TQKVHFVGSVRSRCWHCQRYFDVFQYTLTEWFAATAPDNETGGSVTGTVCAFLQTMTSVRDVLELPELRLRLRTGQDHLHRNVSRIFVTELPDPTRYLYAGEMVLTGLLWWRAAGDADPFVAALAAAG